MTIYRGYDRGNSTPKPTSHHDLKTKLKDSRTRNYITFNEGPRIIVNPGISNRKQVDLYKKYKPYVLESFQDGICSKPSDKKLKKLVTLSG